MNSPILRVYPLQLPSPYSYKSEVTFSIKKKSQTERILIKQITEKRTPKTNFTYLCEKYEA